MRFTPGVELYRKPYQKGTPDFVQVIHLDQGASIRLLHGDITDPRKNMGVFGGDDPRMLSQSLEEYWDDFTPGHPETFCMTNGQFFYMPEYPTRLAFPLKIDGKVISDGWSDKQYPGQKLILEIWPGNVNIRELSGGTLYTSIAPDILGGLTEDANKRARQSVGRTFLGIADRNQDERFETVLIFSTLSSLQDDAASVLKSFGAEKVMMVDGGGSTQLICQGKSIIDSERAIPQAIAILGAPVKSTPSAAPTTAGLVTSSPAPSLLIQAAKVYSLTIVSQPDWPVLAQEEAFEAEVKIKNTGATTWRASETQVWIDPGIGVDRENLSLAVDVHPGETGRFIWRSTHFTEPGVYTISWQLGAVGQPAGEKMNHFNLIVLPKTLLEQSPQLEKKLAQWKRTDPHNIEALARAWIVTEGKAAAHRAESPLPGVIWIPAILIPGAVVVFGLAYWRQQRLRRI